MITVFFLGAIPSDDQIRLTPSMTNKKGKLFKVYFISLSLYLSGLTPSLLFMVR